MATRNFPVIEIFGPTIQGEGALAGVPSHFIRFGGCDYRCSWCDSAHAVLPELVRENARRLDTMQVVREVNALESKPAWVTLSGGNPVLLELQGVVQRLHRGGFRVAVETQGTVWKAWLRDCDLVTLSPKGPSSGNVTPSAQVGKMLEPLDPRKVALKIVVFDSGDYEYARAMHLEFPNIAFYVSVGTMMGGLNGDFRNGVIDSRENLLERYRGLAEKISMDPAMGSIAVLPQLHYLMWGTEKGR